ncbi:hypothetical protein A2630_02210 [Candidatus Woesebacteria bacterium RIFCSPHIGHO2_01_FULL_44_10]|uniref:Ketoreductase domain-containing protein n=1 Tax=Candidatus Woesebacteria bacterium RIFCSPLOWO2_01_FULL_44_14 TaxID=1802525 RepID=A0A1F8C0P6_9BACT|nr:MAG: hypothetical protein A2630_02210 [Candidatus Woesebacteria bacterium RIFCSPHIGHO2_01_FULL_44_10]OGM53963.1 MAG: hypothetical protein A3F62_00130 [Candidatus Woesebacteria bacterium RIFCSPHIGHO2_12_FULL_44_11]OGM69931.1 MAG: hypothetical protein A2975_04965 [Candidatus Woesebacteria bacterium RIFCSPLOWO2_01_FULL_44_14]
MRFKDKVVVVTGSSRGMGREIAIAFGREGAKVVVNYRSNLEEARGVENQVKIAGGEAVSIQADVSHPEEVKKLFEETVKTFGRVDILVNNAGIERPKPFLQVTFEDMEEVFQTNFLGLFVACQEAVKIMQKTGGGKIINTASVRGLDYMGRVGNMDYSASKAAVINFTRTLAKAVAPAICVNAIAPGPTETDMAKTWTAEERAQKERKSRLGRLMQPAEIAQAVLYLASQDGITGEIMVIDGGYSLGSD